jgi:FkbM family methyltransferase
MHPLLNETTYGIFQALAKAWDIRRRNWWEPEIDLVRLGVREGDTVLDIGANYGLYCYHFSRAVGPTGRVLAFEPVPATSSTLRLVSRLLRLRNVEIIPKGCGDETARVAFEVPLQSSGAFSAGQAFLAGRKDDHPGWEEQVRWTGTERVFCEVVRLDDFLPELSNLPWIKCDVEGAELFAFRGARSTIARHRPSVICEINPWYLDGFGVRLDELTSFFFDQDYRLYRYVDGGERDRLVSVAVEDVVEDNYVFIHPTRLDPFTRLLDA